MPVGYEYSHVPMGIWIPWTPVYTGFSADPTAGAARFILLGKLVILIHHRTTAGTSNATGFTISLPVTAGGISRHGVARITDNGTVQTAMGLVEISTGAPTIMTIFKDQAGAAFTASGGKNATFGIEYEAA